MADVREKREVINTEREREREREREISFQKNYNDLDRMVIGFTKNKCTTNNTFSALHHYVCEC
jgi:hypothetical protein